MTLIYISATPAHARILFESEFLLENSGSAWIIDSQDDVSGDLTLQFGTTLGETITWDSGNAEFDISDDINVTGGATLSGALDANGQVDLGDNGDTVSIDSSSWDISTAGIGSGFTGLTSTGTIDFSGASRLALDQGASNPATCTEGDFFYNTTTNYSQLCTATNTWTPQGRRVPDLNAFVDTTTEAVADDDTTDYWDGTYPNITPISTASEILVMVTYTVVSTGNANDYRITRVERAIDANPTCNSSTQVGDELGNSFTTDNGYESNVSAVFVDAPASTGNVRYTLCADSGSSGSPSATMTEIHFTLYEINDAADLAEVYATNDPNISVGDVVSLDSLMKAGVKKSEKAYDSKVLGVVSTQPAKVIGGTGGEGITGVPVALSGRAPIKVITENGPIEPGDLLAPSSTPGVAMKATKPGYILGRSFGSYNKEEVGLVLAFLGTHFADPNLISQ